MDKHLILPFVAVLVGYLVAIIFKSGTIKKGKLVLAFSGAFLLATTVSELFPEIFRNDGKQADAFLLLGVLLQIILEFFSKGAEHGHLHGTVHGRFPMLLYVSLCLHAFLEGMPLHNHGGMTYGIAIHKVPIAFILSIFLLKSGFNRIKSAIIILVFALMSPLGSLVAEHFILETELMHAINAIAAGIVLHVSTTLILESNENHKFNVAKIIVIITAGLLGFLL